MGMHHGILAAGVNGDQLLAALDRLTGEFVLKGDAATIEELPLDNDDEGFAIAVGESRRRSILYDASFVLSAAPDLIVDLSRDLGGTVGAAGAETTSGTYWFIAARHGELVRYHWNSYWGQDAPYDVGAPLASEALDPLEDLDGVGLRAALAELGFEPAAMQRVPLTPYRWTATRPATDGEHAAGLAAFLETHSQPDTGTLPKPAVIRRAGGHDVAPPESRLPRGETGHTPRPQRRRTEPEGIGRRLGRLLGRG
jgi:hypothetical protein